MNCLPLKENADQCRQSLYTGTLKKALLRSTTDNRLRDVGIHDKIVYVFGTFGGLLLHVTLSINRANAVSGVPLPLEWASFPSSRASGTPLPTLRDPATEPSEL